MLNIPVAIYTLASSPATPLLPLSSHSASSVSRNGLNLHKSSIYKEDSGGREEGAFGACLPALPFLNTGRRKKVFGISDSDASGSGSGFMQKEQLWRVKLYFNLQTIVFSVPPLEIATSSKEPSFVSETEHFKYLFFSFFISLLRMRTFFN